VADHAAEAIALGAVAPAGVRIEASSTVAYGERSTRALRPVSHGTCIDR
jgi:hypothetical protein